MKLILICSFTCPVFLSLAPENYFTFFSHKKQHFLYYPLLCSIVYATMLLNQGINTSADGLLPLTSTPSKTFPFLFEPAAWLADTPLMSQVGKDPAG